MAQKFFENFLDLLNGDIACFWAGAVPVARWTVAPRNADTCLKAIWIRFHRFATDQRSLKQVAKVFKKLLSHLTNENGSRRTKEKKFVVFTTSKMSLYNVIHEFDLSLGDDVVDSQKILILTLGYAPSLAFNRWLPEHWSLMQRSPYVVP